MAGFSKCTLEGGEKSSSPPPNDEAEHLSDEEVIQEYDVLDQQLNQLNSCLDVLEQQNNALNDKLKTLLESNRKAREELAQEGGNDQEPKPEEKAQQ